MIPLPIAVPSERIIIARGFFHRGFVLFKEARDNMRGRENVSRLFKRQAIAFVDEVERVATV